MKNKALLFDKEKASNNINNLKLRWLADWGVYNVCL